MMNKPKTFLCAIAKNESAYLIEWLAYHKYIVGFDEIIIYNNDSTDMSEHILQKLSEYGLCKYKNWPTTQNTPPQIPSYQDMIREYTSVNDWVCFLDIDEFIYLKHDTSIHNLVDRCATDNVGSISINWLFFGGNNQYNYTNDLVINRFRRSSQMPDYHVKSITKVDAISKIYIHVCKLYPQYVYKHINGTILNLETENPNMEHISKDKRYRDITHGQINHYRCKSFKEYCNRILRGAAHVMVNRYKDYNELNMDSYNETINIDITRHSAQTLKNMNNIYHIIGLDKNMLLSYFKNFFDQQQLLYHNRYSEKP